MLNNIKGRHWVFIIGFICSMIMGFVNSEVATGMLTLLMFMGIGIAFFR